MISRKHSNISRTRGSTPWRHPVCSLTRRGAAPLSPTLAICRTVAGACVQTFFPRPQTRREEAVWCIHSVSSTTLLSTNLSWHVILAVPCTRLIPPSAARQVCVCARAEGGGHVFRALVLVKRSALQQAEDEMMRACACTHVNLERTDPSQTLAHVGDSILIVGKATILEPASSFSTSASTAQTAGRSGAQKLGR